MSIDSRGWEDLWDQQPAVNDYTGKGIDYLEKIGSYAKERAAIELEYSAKLKACAKKYSTKSKNETELWNAVSHVRGFQDYLAGINPIAAQHEMIAENLKQNVIPFATTKVTEYRSAKKQLETDQRNMQFQMNAVSNDLAKSNKEYSKAFKESEAAMLKYLKADKNLEISRIDLEKSKVNYDVKCGQLETAKQAYVAMHARANAEKSNHFEKKIPLLLENYKALHTNRILDTIETLNRCVESESSVNSIIASCHNDMRENIAKIDPAKDALIVVENLKTGLSRPGPYILEDLGHPKSFLGGGSHDNIDSTLKKGTLLSRKDAKGVARKPSMHQKFFGGGNDKKSDNDDYGTLPPQQRARKLMGKINDLEREKERAVQSREGLLKMQSAYRSNPQLGNPSDCDTQLNQYSVEIDSLSNQIQKIRIVLDDINAQLGTTASSVGGSDTPPSVRSVSSASSGVTSRVNTLNDSNRMARKLSYTGSGESDGGQSSNGNGDGVTEQIANPSVLGEAVAQFPFEGTQEGTIQMDAGERLFVVERDEGDGWTRVRKTNNSSDGFVPSTYIQITWHDGGRV